MRSAFSLRTLALPAVKQAKNLRPHLVEQCKAPVKLGLGAATPRAQQSHNARDVTGSIQEDALAALAISSRPAGLLVIPLEHTCVLRVLHPGQ